MLFEGGSACIQRKNVIHCQMKKNKVDKFGQVVLQVYVLFGSNGSEE